MTDKVGLNQNNSRFSLAASWEDFDNDGDADLYVASDFGQANLYVNDGGRFRDEARERGAMNQAAGMGVTWSDFDGDGNFDLYVSNMYSAPGVRVVRAPQFRSTDTPEQREMFRGHVMGNSLFRGKGGGKFEDISSRIESRFVGWSWGSLFADINGDGWDDLLVPNGNLSGSREADIDGLFWRHVASESPLTVAAAPKYEDGWAAMSLLMNDGYSWSGHQRNVTYLNVGPTEPLFKGPRIDLSSDFHRPFVDVSTLSGFGHFDDARAVALTDWDHDGDLDAWVRNRTAPMLRFLRNMTKENEGDQPRSRFLSLVLVGADGNRQAIGARVEAFAGTHGLVRSVRAGEGYLSQSSDRVLLNIPNGEELSELAVRWPSGRQDEFTIPALDHAYRLTEGRGPEAEPIAPRTPTRLTDRVAPIPAASDVGVRRTLLVDRFALPPMELRTIDGRITNTESKIGKPCLWVFWSARSRRSMEALRQLSQGIDELIQRDIEVIPICVDDDDVLPASVVGASFIDPGLPVITCPPELFDLIDAMQQEVHGSPQDLSLPTAWIVDRLGLVVSVQRDGIDLAAAMEDARRPAQPSTLFAGRVQFPMGRNFGVIAQQLRQRGATAFAEYYRELAERLRARPPRPAE